MTRKRFFVESAVPGEGTIDLGGDAAHHIEHVLRLRAGEEVELIDGVGGGWLGAIVETGTGTVRVRITGRLDAPAESSLNLSLALAFSRADRMDLVLRQATEIGVNRFIAFRSRRSQYGLTGRPAGKRLERWQRIAREAVCQCGRLNVPEMVILSDIREVLAKLDQWERSGNLLRILAFERGNGKGIVDLHRAFPRCTEVMVAVGPEGGWSSEEAELLTRNGFHAVHLGPRILRLETAAAIVLSSVQLLWGDLGA